ncbi:M48 family metallopeptidase [Tranquillimonas alkanivorans]|uniref:YgjP-like metallopeptidase domain-containing protein n=1 Tax=Tranquillimonas alkanivorans TaxID=441119 RepID=A0A1I5PE38_9RHOB|nr:SprT family zinc-dependent metalloprotease [Tranquillimonas alkanivorans]SFP32339.1 hypothetical protein SAMN04488047_10562 [Tranquillimonas alkanivorans]
MGQATLPGNPPIEIVMRRSTRARRISLRVSGLDGRVTLTLPRRTKEADALAFAREKEAWLRAALDRRPEEARPLPGVALPVEGRERLITAGPVRAARIEEARIVVPEGRPCGPRVAAALKLLARERLAEAVGRHAAAVGRPHGRITLRDTRSRWGSCNSRGDLMFSWRLILAPAEVLDYVAAHEVAHLAHMDHSPRFWAAVARLMPDFEAPRLWLRQNGGELHRWRFTD